MVQSALRIGSFQKARSEALVLREEQPADAFALAVYGDAMWSAGLFEEAERGYTESLALQPGEARGHNGLARVLSARARYDEALEHAMRAVRLAPREADYHHTLGNVYERLGQYDHAATALGSFINLLPKGLADSRAAWAASEFKFLTSFGKQDAVRIRLQSGRRSTRCRSGSRTRRSSSRAASTAAGRSISSSTRARNCRRFRARRASGRT